MHIHITHRKNLTKKLAVQKILIGIMPHVTFFDRIQHKNKITPYLDMTLQGVVIKTIIAGRDVYVRGQGHVGCPGGQLIVSEQALYPHMKSKI